MPTTKSWGGSPLDVIDAEPPARLRNRLSSLFRRRHRPAPTDENAPTPARPRHQPQWSGGTDLAMIFTPQSPTIPPTSPPKESARHSSRARRQSNARQDPPALVPDQTQPLPHGHSLEREESTRSLRSMVHRRPRSTSGSFCSLSSIFHARRPSSSRQPSGRAVNVPPVPALPAVYASDTAHGAPHAPNTPSSHEPSTPPVAVPLHAHQHAHSERTWPQPPSLEPIQSSLDEPRADAPLPIEASAERGDKENCVSTFVFPSSSLYANPNPAITNGMPPVRGAPSVSSRETTVEHTTDASQRGDDQGEEDREEEFDDEDDEEQKEEAAVLSDEELDETLRNKIFRGKAKVFEATQVVGMDHGTPVVERVEVKSKLGSGSGSAVGSCDQRGSKLTDVSANGSSTDPDVLQRALDGGFYSHVNPSTAAYPHLKARPRSMTNPVRRLPSTSSLSPAAEVLAHGPPIRAHVDPSQIVRPRGRVTSSLGPSRSALGVGPHVAGQRSWGRAHMYAGAGLGLASNPMVKQSMSQGLFSGALAAASPIGAGSTWSPTLRAHVSQAELKRADADVSELSPSMALVPNGVAEDKDAAAHAPEADVLDVPLQAS